MQGFRPAITIAFAKVGIILLVILPVVALIKFIAWGIQQDAYNAKMRAYLWVLVMPKLSPISLLKNTCR